MRDVNEANCSQKRLCNPLPGICSFGLIHVDKLQNYINVIFLVKWGKNKFYKKNLQKHKPIWYPSFYGADL